MLFSILKMPENLSVSVESLLCCLLMLLGLNQIDGQNSWEVRLEGLGTFSSPRCVDLTGDGIKDIIIGAGREEFNACDSAIMAIDGLNGKIIWKVKARDQIFGSTTLLDIDGDQVDDIIIGGRSAELKAISGATGQVIWEFFRSSSTDAPREAGWYNFYNPQLIDDVNNDGLSDIIVSNGGDVKAEPYDPNRPAGHLMVLDGKTGTLLAKADMPDGKEIYMSIICFRPSPDISPKIIFGTGGETLGGNLFVADLQALLNSDLSHSIQLASSPDKGYIAPPVAVDLTGDQILDAIVMGVDGTVSAFSGVDFKLLWQTKINGCEAYSSLAVGNFTNDTVPDFFVSIAAGVWPKLEWNRQFMLNGKNGNIEFIDSLGFYQTSTAVVFDFNQDHQDDVLLSINYQVQNQIFQKFFHNMLAIIDFKTGEMSQITDALDGNNIASTPWIGDLDDDGLLDIIYIHATNLRHTYTFDGMQINRIETNYPIHSSVSWGAYMGSSYNGILQGKPQPMH
ncbi:MAG: PQQ-binding-like beta-propeller repeat protein [Saprospiraceae bacterium]|nr:PQQ-binding-like beta-propeller repeat protein [Saprospiraceae bacterium]